MSKYTLNGTIKANSQAMFRQLTIEVWDKEPQQDRKLYTVSVDESGHFSIPFSARIFRNKPAFSLTGVYLKIYQGKQLLLSTEGRAIKTFQTGKDDRILLDLSDKETKGVGKQEAYRLESLSGISTDKAAAIRKKLGHKALHYSLKGIQGLVQNGLLNQQEANKLHLVSALDQLPNVTDKVIVALKDKEWASLGNRSASSLRDMVLLEREDIVDALTEEEEVDLSDAVKMTIADGILTSIETTFPTERLIQGVVLPKEQLSSLLKDAITNASSEKVAEGLRQTYQAFSWQKILQDENLSLGEKTKKIEQGMGAVEQFFAQNPDFNLLEASLTTKGLQQYNFEGIDTAYRAPLIQTLKNFLRVLKVAPNTGVAKRLLASGYASSFDIANDSLNGLIKKTGLSQQEATSLYRVSKNQAVQVVNTWVVLKDAHSPVIDPTAPGGSKGLVPEEHDLLAELDDYEDFFGNQSFCTCKDCASILSPAAYFVDLMDYIEKNITENSFDGATADHFLKLRNRRPDLWNLPLTCENTNERIPYLVIIIEVLEQYLIQRQEWKAETLYQELSQSIESFHQPFHLPLATLSAYLKHFDLELKDLLKFLVPGSLAANYAQLNLSVEAANLLENPATNSAFLETLYGLNLNALESIAVPILLPKTGLSRDELGRILKTNFVKGNSEVIIKTGRKSEASIQNDIEFIENSTPDVLDRLHRFVRLWRHLPWNIQELDLVLSKVGMDLVRIANIRQVQQDLGQIPLMDLLGILGEMPAETFNTVFNLPYFERTEGTLPDDQKWLLHPAFKEETDAIEDPMVHRLLAGLQLNDDDFLLLIQHLTVELRFGQDPKNLSIQLSQKNLNLLYQHATLAQAMRLSVADFLLLKEVAGVDVFIGNELEQVEKILSIYQEIEASPLSIQEWHSLIKSKVFAIETAKEWRVKLFESLEEGTFNTELELDNKTLARKLLPEITTLSAEILEPLFSWLEISIESSTLFSYWKEQDSEEILLEKLIPLAQWVLLIRRFSIDIRELEAFKNNEALLGLKNVALGDLLVENITYLARYVQLRVRLNLEGNEVDLFYLLGLFSQNDIESEALLTTIDVREDYLRLLVKYIELPKHSIDAFTHLLNALEIAQLLGINGESLSLIGSNDYNELERAAQALVAAFRAKYNSKVANDLGQSIENKLLEAKRTALSDYLVNSIHPEFKNQHDLYYYFLLDTELESCATTSRVLAANASLQLYVQRVMMQLEQDKDRQLSAQLATGAKEWEWRKNYRVWEANRKVFLYPENYIRPELRSDKTQLFKTLEDTLLQQDVNAASVNEAYKNYLTQFSEIANLKFAGAYHHEDVLHMVGRTTTDPKAHYYRTYNLSSNRWSSWAKIETSITADHVSPIIFKNTLHIFWFEIVSKPIKEFVEGESRLKHYEHVIHLKYTSVQANGKWQTVQTITLPHLGVVDPKSKNGKVIEIISNDVLVISKKNIQEIDDTYTLEGVRWSRPYLFINKEKEEDQIALYYDHHSGPLGDIYFNLSLYQNQATKTEAVSMEAIPDRNRYIFNGYPEGKLTVQFLNNDSVQTIAYASPMSYYYFASAVMKQTDVNTDAFVLAKHSSEINPPKIYAINNLVDYHVVEFDKVSYLMVPLNTHPYIRPYKAIRLTTNMATQLSEKVHISGLVDMLALSTQKNTLEYDALYDPTGIRLNAFVQDYDDKFIERSPYSIYMRELFFHIPSLIASQLNNNRKYKEAQDWYHYIFNPLAADNRIDNKESFLFPYDRVWQYLGFRTKETVLLRQLLTNSAAIDAYKKDPFNPHAIATVREGTYQKTTVMNYIDNLLDWGDQLFGMDTFESINEASLLYIMASDILGKRPVDIGDCERPSGDYIQSYEGMNNNLIDENNSEFLKEVEALLYTLERTEEEEDVQQSTRRMVQKSSKTSSLKKMELGAKKMLVLPRTKATASPKATVPTSNYLGNSAYQSNGIIKDPLTIDISGMNSPTDYQTYTPTRDWNDYVDPPTNTILELATQKALLFCVPNNHQLLDYWDRVEDRLYKIRHCMNLQGTKRQLELLQPAIDPMMLVRAKAAGLSIQDILAELSDSQNSLYQFRYLLEKANGLAAFAQSLGNAMLSALEKRDAEGLSLIRSEHQLNLQSMETQLHEQRIVEIQKGKESIALRKEQTMYRLSYYQALMDENLIKEERQHLNLKSSAQSFMKLNLDLYLGRGIASSTYPTILGLAGLEVNPGKLFDAMLNNRITMHSAWSGILQSRASTQATHASYKRRLKGWKYQEQLIQEELKVIEKQEIINEIQLKGAEHSLSMHHKRIEYTKEVYDFLKNKFGNKQLYSWLTNELQGMYRQAYKMAYEMAKEAEAAYRFESNKNEDSFTSFIKGVNWESQKAGLLAGQKLAMQLTQLEQAYHNDAERRMEIQQSFSLRLTNPQQLLQLQEHGTCDIILSERFFDLIYPGQYKRRLRSISITIPCVTGPYTNINATLTLINSKIRRTSIDSPLTFAQRGDGNSIALSGGDSDSGLLFTDFYANKYLPFEGAGAISNWKLELPNVYRSFDYKTISDVIVNVAYTAQYNGSYDKTTVENALKDDLASQAMSEGMTQYLNLKQHFPSEFRHLLVRSPHQTTLTINERFLPYYLQSRLSDIKIIKGSLIVEKSPQMNWTDIDANLTIDNVDLVILDNNDVMNINLGENFKQYAIENMEGAAFNKTWSLVANTTSEHLEEGIKNIHLLIFYYLDSDNIVEI